MLPSQPMRILRKGMRGQDVRRWQRFLIAQGLLAGRADGIFGNLTHGATVEFQRKHGLLQDGVVGRQTQGQAFGRPEDVVVPPAVTGDRVNLSPAILKQIMPGIPAARAAEYAPHIQHAMTEFRIDSPPRAAAFLAQLAHESGQLRWMEEIWGPTRAQRRYEPPTRLARTLGNTQPGDGFRFKGRGPIQLTGRANYRVFGAGLGLDLIANPRLAASKEVGFRIAGLYWKKRGLNPLADAMDFWEITRRINGGHNGLADRQRFYRLARQVFGVPARRAAGAPAPRSGRDGAWRRFTRGLDAPGEITPTAVERAPSRRAGGAAGRAPATRGTKAVRRTSTARKPVRKAVRPKAPGKGRAKAGKVKRQGAKPRAAKRSVRRTAK